MQTLRTKTLISFVLALAMAHAVSADTKVEERRPAAADGIVRVDSGYGKLQIIGWDRAEIEVRGTRGEDTEGLALQSGERRTLVQVKLPREQGTGLLSGIFPKDYAAELEVRVPAGSRVEIQSVEAAIQVSGVRGDVEVTSVGGSVKIQGEPRQVKAETVSGSIELVGSTPSFRAETLNGAVRARGLHGDAVISSVSGDVALEQAAIRQGELTSLSGAVRYQGSLGKGARLALSNHGGDVYLLLPQGTQADFRVRTVKGKIENLLVRQAQAKTAGGGSNREQAFSSGSGGASVTVETFQGNIFLRTPDAASQGR